MESRQVVLGPDGVMFAANNTDEIYSLHDTDGEGKIIGIDTGKDITDNTHDDIHPDEEISGKKSRLDNISNRWI